MFDVHPAMSAVHPAPAPAPAPAPTTSAVRATPPADPSAALAHFSAALAFETDVSDVYADLRAGVDNVFVVDSRGDAAWAQGHLPGAIHLPTAQIADRAASVIPPGGLVVTYCWGPGCNGATRAALAFARLGYQVKQMIGGYEYWVREGFPVVTPAGTVTRAADPLTAPADPGTVRTATPMAVAVDSASPGPLAVPVRMVSCDC